jgi:hypothetical protein
MCHLQGDTGIFPKRNYDKLPRGGMSQIKLKTCDGKWLGARIYI